MTPMKKFLRKSRTLATISLIFSLSLGISACSNNEKQKPKYKTIQTLNQQQNIATGMVVAVRTVKIKPDAINSYGNIGVAADSSGFRGVHGSIDLSTLSRIFKNTTSTKTAQEIIVKKNTGQTVVITQVTTEIFKKGDSVKVLIRDGETQVIH